MQEWCLVADGEVVWDGFYSREEAEAELAKSDPDDELEVDERDKYHEDGQWIEESDGDEDDEDDEDDE